MFVGVGSSAEWDIIMALEAPLELGPGVVYTRVVPKTSDLSHHPHMATFHFYYNNEFITTILHGRINYVDIAHFTITAFKSIARMLQ